MQDGLDLVYAIPYNKIVLVSCDDATPYTGLHKKSTPVCVFQVYTGLPTKESQFLVTDPTAVLVVVSSPYRCRPSMHAEDQIRTTSWRGNIASHAKHL